MQASACSADRASIPDPRDVTGSRRHVGTAYVLLDSIGHPRPIALGHKLAHSAHRAPLLRRGRKKGRLFTLVSRFRSSPNLAARPMRTSESKDTSKSYDSSAALNPKLATHFRQFRASFGFAALGRCATQRHLQARIVAHPLTPAQASDKRQIVIFGDLRYCFYRIRASSSTERRRWLRDQENIFAGTAGQTAAWILYERSSFQPSLT